MQNTQLTARVVAAANSEELWLQDQPSLVHTQTHSGCEHGAIADHSYPFMLVAMAGKLQTHIKHVNYMHTINYILHYYFEGTRAHFRPQLSTQTGSHGKVHCKHIHIKCYELHAYICSTLHIQGLRYICTHNSVCDTGYSQQASRWLKTPKQ